MKKYIILLLILILNSCTKDLDLPYEKSDQTIVVNCLFSEDQPWKVTLTRIRSFSDSSDTYVEDARVVIVPENNDTIHLSYSGNGVFLSEEVPASGLEYQLVIKEGNQNEITAKSAIPVKPVISDINPSTQKTIYFSNPNLSDYEVLPLNFKIAGDVETNFVRFRLYTFNTKVGYTRYMVTQETISKLRERRYPQGFLSELEKLIGVSMTEDQAWSVIFEIAQKYGPPYNGIDVTSELKKIKVTTRYDDAFRSGYLFSNNVWSSNVSSDIFNVLGEYSGTVESNLFVSYIPVLNKNDQTDYMEEYWLEVVGMSADYYKYQKSYIKQVENKNNPFASVTEVYSNIQNGVGIFGGYNRQMIHIHDY